VHRNIVIWVWTVEIDQRFTIEVSTFVDDIQTGSIDGRRRRHRNSFHEISISEAPICSGGFFLIEVDLSDVRPCRNAEVTLSGDRELKCFREVRKRVAHLGNQNAISSNLPVICGTIIKVNDVVLNSSGAIIYTLLPSELKDFTCADGLVNHQVNRCVGGLRSFDDSLLGVRAPSSLIRRSNFKFVLDISRQPSFRE